VILPARCHFPIAQPGPFGNSPTADAKGRQKARATTVISGDTPASAQQSRDLRGIVGRPDAPSDVGRPVSTIQHSCASGTVLAHHSRSILVGRHGFLAPSRFEIARVQRHTNREERDGLRAIATSLMIALTVVVFGFRHDRRAERSDTNSYIHTSFADVEPAHHDHRCPPIATLM